MEKPLKGKKIAILAGDGVEASELLEPKKAMEGAGAISVVVSPKAGEIQLMKHDEKNGTISVDLELRFAMADQFDGVLIPGGALNADLLRMDPDAKKFVLEMEREEKPIAAICHAPWLLVSSGLVDGRRVAAYYTIQDDIRNAGGEWIDQPVVRDDNWVTSRQPSDIPEFIREMIRLFSEAVVKYHPSAYVS